MSAPPQRITEDMATALYLEELQRQRTAMSPVDQKKKSFIIGKSGGRWIVLSIQELIAQLQSGAPLAKSYAIEYVQQLKGPQNQQLYVVS